MSSQPIREAWRSRRAPVLSRSAAPEVGDAEPSKRVRRLTSKTFSFRCDAELEQIVCDLTAKLGTEADAIRFLMLKGVEASAAEEAKAEPGPELEALVGECLMGLTRQAHVLATLAAQWRAGLELILCTVAPEAEAANIQRHIERHFPLLNDPADQEEA